MRRGYARLIGLVVVVVAAGLVVSWSRHESGEGSAPRRATSVAAGELVDLASWPRRAPRWQVTIPEGRRGLELVAHPPLVVGARVIVAGSRVGWVGLTLDGGAIAWRRAASPALAAPRASGDELILLDECGGAVAADPGDAVLACVTWVAAHDGAIRRVGAIRGSTVDVGRCPSEPGPWRLTLRAPPAVASLGRGSCRFELDLDTGRARRTDDVAPAADDLDPDRIVVEAERPPWTRRLVGGRPVVVAPTGAPILPGLTVLAADPGAGAGAGAGAAPVTLVRRDASLRDDVLVGGGWWWPLPDPGADGRAGPAAVASTPAAVVAFFDGDRVALFAP